MGAGAGVTNDGAGAGDAGTTEDDGDEEVRVHPEDEGVGRVWRSQVEGDVPR